MTFSRIRGNSSDEKMVHPNHIVYRKMENLINQMLNNEDGVPIKTVKSFLSKIPSVFTGIDIIAWILRNVEVADLSDALHLAHLLASHGYIFQIDDHVLTVKNDGTFYRFQTPYFWPSNCWEPENTDYAVYLCKRTMQNKAHLELEDFEAENLAKLQKMFSRKWEFVFMQAEAQYKVDKKRDRLERQILDSQERAFWDVHRPVPGCVNTTEVDFRKLSRSGRPKYSASNNSVHAATCSADCQTHHQHMLRCAMMDGGSSTPAAVAASAIAAANGADPKQVLAAGGGDGASSSSTSTSATLNYRDSKVYHQRPGLRRCTHMSDSLKYEIGILQNRLAKNVLKTSKVIENYLQYYDHRKVFDAFLVQLGSSMDPFQGQPNPWISDTVDFWQHDRMYDSSTGDISTRRLKLWEESFEELLSDMLGRETLQKFLDKEYSGENLRFWWEVQKLRKCSCRMVPVLVTEIYNEFIDSNATSPVNIDCKVMEITEENLTNPNRWSFDEAADHIFCLMKNDSYQRFLRSDIYRDLVNLSRKKSSLAALISRKTSRKSPMPRALTKSASPTPGCSSSNNNTVAAAAAAASSSNIPFYGNNSSAAGAPPSSGVEVVKGMISGTSASGSSNSVAPVKLSRDIGLRFPNLSSFTTNPTKRDSSNSQQQQQQQQHNAASATAPSSAASTVALGMNPPFGTNNSINSSSNNNVPHLIHMSSAPGPSNATASSNATGTAAADRASPSSSHSLHQQSSTTTIGLNDF